MKLKKYDVWFCNCGHIHLMDRKWFDWMREDYINRQIVRVCRICGTIYKQFLDPYEDGFCICSADIGDEEFNANSNMHFIFSRGIAVPTVAGLYAEYRSPSGVWYAPTEVYDEVRNDDPDFHTVDTNQLIHNIQREYREDADDILNSISGYVSGIDWTNTPYSYEAKRSIEGE